MSVLPALPANSFSSTTTSVHSKFTNKNEAVACNKVCKIALAILTGLGVVLGITALAIGTFASAGTLPIAALFIATVIFGIASIAFTQQAIKGEKLFTLGGTESIELDGQPLTFEQGCETSAVKLPTEHYNWSQIEQQDDICAFIDEGNKEVGRRYPNGIHPHFARDCVRDRLNISMDGKPISELFSVECQKLTALERTRSVLQEQANESSDEAIQEQLQAKADKAEEEFTHCQSDLKIKIMGELTRLIAEKFGEESPLLAPISASLCQDMGILLKNKVRNLSLNQFNGELASRGTDPKISYTYAVKFPTDGRCAAKIEIEATGQFHSILLAGEMIPQELAAPCLQYGSASISIAHSGQAVIESYVALIP